MKKPQDVRVWEVKERRKSSRTNRLHIVRWVVEGQEFNAAKATKEEARDLHARLFTAMLDGETFDAVQGRPASWIATPVPTLVVWAHQWVAEEWDTWQPRTRSSVIVWSSRRIPEANRWAPVVFGGGQFLAARSDGDYRMKASQQLPIRRFEAPNPVECHRRSDRRTLLVIDAGFRR